MTNGQSPIAFRAAWILPVRQPPVKDGWLVVRDAVIESITRRQPDCRRCDLGSVALIPPLINAHTHLEFSHLAAPLGQPGMRFVDWLSLVIAQRSQTTRVELAEICRAGANAAQRSGTAAICEIASTEPTDQSREDSQPHILSMLECRGNDPLQHDAVVSNARQFLERHRGDPSVGLSPHAPYSVPLPLLEQLVELANQYQVPVAMHIAETPEELELLSHGRGDFPTFLKRIGAWFPTAQYGHCDIGDYLNLLVQAPRTLIVHGNYLQRHHLRALADYPNCSIVYCPRTHEYFQHQSYPLRQLLDNKINVAVGTDSKASNPDLSVWLELKTIARQFPGLPRCEILKMGTLNGAQALGLDSYGDLTPGKRAWVNVLAIDAPNRDPYSAALEGDASPELWDLSKPPTGAG